MSHRSAEVLASFPGVHTEDVPTGSSSGAAERYFQWLYENYLGGIPNAVGGIPAQWEGVHWGGPFLQLYALAVVFVVFFALFARYLNETHRKRVAYKLSRYDRVTERHGRFGPFSIAVTLGIVAWALYYPINHVVTGQVY